MRSHIRPGKATLLLLSVALAAPLVVRAQTPIAAPSGWKVQAKAGGARAFTPPDLGTGEVYSVTVYESVSLDGKTLAEFLRAFGGTVGTRPGQLKAPLQVEARDGRIVTGSGVYRGPNNTALGVLFTGVSLDGGANVHIERTLFSSAQVLERYKNANLGVVKSLVERARREAGSNLLRVPAAVTQKMKPGGALVPGVYAGNQYTKGELRYRFRVYVYPNGEYRVTDHNDADFKDRWGDVDGVGRYTYNRNSGQIELDRGFDLNNDSRDLEDAFCFYGRDAAGKPLIYSEERIFDRVTELRYVGPPTKRPSPATEKARQAAIEAEKKRYKWVTAPGKGVPATQVAAVLHHYDVQVYSAGVGGMGTNTTDEAYLLLRDGSIHAGLAVPPDQLDVVRSRQHEPQSWGRWRQQGGKYQVSWDGGPYQALKGNKVLPSPAQLRLAGRYGTASSSATMLGGSYEFWGVTFDKSGRFKTDSRGGSSNAASAQITGMATVNTYHDDEGSMVAGSGENFAFTSKNKKNNPNGAREGSYSLNGYTLTLRFDNGRVERVPFFFRTPKRDELWFRGDLMSLDKPKTR